MTPCEIVSEVCPNEAEWVVAAAAPSPTCTWCGSSDYGNLKIVRVCEDHVTWVLYGDGSSNIVYTIEDNQ